jgi:ADP-ribosyl-[dinitrogen reductase] hydrolase
MTNIDSELLNRARGCVVGAAIGDALGMPLEFRLRRPLIDMVVDMESGRLPAGSFTDDTEMALALAESLLVYQPLDPADLADRFLAWYRANPADIGTHTRAVLSHIDHGMPWDVAAATVQQQHPEAAGNGSVMRCWPAAVVEWNHMEDLVIDSWQQSRVTHMHRDCTTACTFINVMIANMLRGTLLDASFEVAKASVRVTPAMWTALDNLPTLRRGDLSNSGWVLHTLESALWGLFNFNSFEETVIQVANLGNDADTAASVVGALAGARYGLESIPVRWLAALHGEWPVGSGTFWTVDNFIELADKLITVRIVSTE